MQGSVAAPLPRNLMEVLKAAQPHALSHSHSNRDMDVLIRVDVLGAMIFIRQA